ncbi:hypothetical protein Ancab_020451 [Ancistrocladus abbreviatus]
MLQLRSGWCWAPQAVELFSRNSFKGRCELSNLESASVDLEPSHSTEAKYPGFGCDPAGFGFEWRCLC